MSRLPKSPAAKRSRPTRARRKPALRTVEQALREHKQLLSSITQNISDGIYRRIPGQGLIFVNDALVKMFRYASAEEMMAAPGDSLYANVERRRELISLTERDAGFHNQEVEFRRKDGTHFWGLVSSVGVRDEATGKVLYLDGAITDITERKKAEGALRELNADLERRIAAATAELRESQERFTKAFRASPVSISIARLSDGKFVEVNDAFLQGSGFTREEVLGRTSADLGLWADPADREWVLRELRERGFVSNRESLIRYKSGQTRTILVSAERIEIGNQPHILAASLDITTRKEAEAELHNALDRERELSQLKSNFVSLVSHEFRTPLGIIMSSGEILDRYLDRLTPEDRREHLQAIHQATRRMAHLMEEVLVLSRVEAGKFQFNPRPVDLGGLLRHIVEDVRSANPQSGRIDFVTRLDSSGAHADDSLLQHIFTNLLSNAIKYSPADAAVAFSVERQNADAIFEIRDRGIGIAPEDIARLFEAFHRGRNVGERPGSGLGMVIVKRCVDIHGGSIDVQSRINEGTTVIVRLPLFSPPHSEKQMVSPPETA